MTTVRDLIQDSVRKIGALAAGEALDANAAADHLRELNRMMAAWNQKDVLVYTMNRTTFALTAGKQAYTLGIGGDFNMARPAHIDMMSVLINGSSSPMELPLDMFSDDDWQGVVMKSIVSSWPTGVYIQGDMPLNTLRFWPIPTAPCSVIIGAWQRTLAFANLTDDVVFPDGYEDAIVYNLAVRLAPEYEREATATVQRLAQYALRAVADSNYEQPVSDPGFNGSNGLLVIKSRGIYMP